MNHRTIRKYNLNPGVDDVTNGIIPRLLMMTSPLYPVCQFAEEKDTWYMRRMENLEGEVRDAGSMWLEGPQTLCVASSDPVVISAVESQKGVRLLEKYRQF